MECITLLEEFQAVSETVKPIKLLSSGKAPGSAAIPAEIYKAGGHPVAEKLTECFILCGEKKPSLTNSRMQQLYTISKGKGILKSVTFIGHLFIARVLRNRLNEHFEQSGLLPESQC